MKKKRIFALLFVIILATVLVLTGCGKSGAGSGSSGGGDTDEPMTLEQYAVENPEVQESIANATADSDVEIEIKGNDIIYSFELSKMEGYTEDVAKDPNVIASLQKALDNAGATFGGIAKTLETATEISGIHVTVIYTYDGEVLATQTFDSADADAAPAEESEESGSDSESEGEEEADDAA